jgi:signal transduction histidine kinase/putative methionine-R-sulfoxide reductase with GAF domain
VSSRRALAESPGRHAGPGAGAAGDARLGARLRAVDRLARLAVSAEPLEAVLDAFVEGAAALVPFESLAIALLDPGGEAFTVLDPVGRASGLGTRREGRHPIGGTLLAGLAADGASRRVDDVAAVEVPEASRRALGRAGYRSVLMVPLAAPGAVRGAVVLAAHRPGAFGQPDLEVVEELSRPLAAAVEHARLRDESRRRTEELASLAEENLRRARETRALLEAGRAVTASLDVGETIRVIMEEARSVLGVESCGLMTLDAASGELVSVASLDLPPEMVSRIRLRVGEGIAGLAVSEGRPVQSADLDEDARVRYRQLSRGSGFRSMMAAPLRAGDGVVGAITVLRRDVHRFSADEEQLLVALADQAAIALEHARLYTQLEGMVTERTRELDAQRRFVEVVLEALPLGVFVLDAGLRVVRVNREGARLLARDAEVAQDLTALLPAPAAARLAGFLRAGLDGAPSVRPEASRLEEEVAVGGETRLLRFTAAPLEVEAAHLVLLVEDVTLAKRFERQMLLTERLTTAGRLAAGVAHELNNPLATIAGCAEALRSRLGEGALAALPEAGDFRDYLGLIEEEAYRCKEITGSLLGFVREPGSRRAPTDLNTLVVKTVELLSHQSRFTRDRFVTDLAPDLPPVTVNEGQLRQVFLGLAANALDAMGDRGLLRLRTRPAPGEVEVEFEDEGPGMSDEILARIFDPFFTTKPPGQGTGLGLAIAQSIVTDHGGRIDVTSRPGTGSVFRVVLPL